MAKRFLLAIFIQTLLLVDAVGQTHFSKADLDENGKTNIENKFSVFEIARYEPVDEAGMLFIENGYAKSVLADSLSWKSLMDSNKAVEINLIYTKYPRNKELWRTNYRKLLTERLKTLFAMDPSLNSAQIEWNIVLQTDCNTEPEAMAMLHGFEIIYEPIVDETVVDTSVVVADTIAPKSKEEIKADKYGKKFDRMLKRHSDQNDSTIINVFGRNDTWKQSLVVMDWSGSMHGFSMNVMRWHAKNFKTSGIKNVVLFTDGERGKKGKVGDSGGIFYSEASDFKSVIRLMRQSSSGYYNKKIEENNIEGLIKASIHFPEFDELIMIADNRSCMKDYCLCEVIDKPVRIVLCGTTYGINPQYINLAYQLGGSIHTIDSDIMGFEAYKVEGTELNIDGWRFKFNPKTNLFEAVNHTELMNRPFQDCDRFYKQTGRCKKMIAKFSKQLKQ